MYYSNIKESHHDWEKQNLVTLNSRGKMFDEMKCTQCGMKGRRYGFESVVVSESYNIKNVHLCPKAKLPETAQRVRVIKCTANGKAFANLIPDSEHDVITPPEGYENDHKGVWVMGVGEPVKLLNNEFSQI